MSNWFPRIVLQNKKFCKITLEKIDTHMILLSNRSYKSANLDNRKKNPLIVELHALNFSKIWN